MRGARPTATPLSYSIAARPTPLSPSGRRIIRCWIYLSLSRLDHGQPGVQAYSEVVQGTTEFHHQITDPLLPQADPVLHNATTLDAAVDMLDPEPPLVERLVGQVLLQ